MVQRRQAGSEHQAPAAVSESGADQQGAELVALPSVVARAQSRTSIQQDGGLPTDDPGIVQRWQAESEHRAPTALGKKGASQQGAELAARSHRSEVGGVSAALPLPVAPSEGWPSDLAGREMPVSGYPTNKTVIMGLAVQALPTTKPVRALYDTHFDSHVDSGDMLRRAPGADPDNVPSATHALAVAPRQLVQPFLALATQMERPLNYKNRPSEAQESVADTQRRTGVSPTVAIGSGQRMAVAMKFQAGRGSDGDIASTSETASPPFSNETQSVPADPQRIRLDDRELERVASSVYTLIEQRLRFERELKGM